MVTKLDQKRIWAKKRREKRAINAKASTQDGLRPSCVILDEVHAQTECERKHLFSASAVMAAIFGVILMLLFCPRVQASEAAENQMAAILYAEAANDPQGWEAKLNTYYKARRNGESLEGCMRRVSSAYRTRSRQYIKASTGDLNAFEERVYTRILNMVRVFRPDPGWTYIKHENFDLYESPEAALKHLRRAWGNDVNYAKAKKIGKEHYFPKS